MLMTTRRSPVYPGAAAAAAVGITLPGRMPTMRPNFFKRHFSTYTERPTQSKKTALRKITELLLHKQRLSESSAGNTTDSHATQVHRRVKNRMVARSHYQEFTAPTGFSIGGLDIRLIRGRSPRSADYFHRTVHSKQLLSAPLQSVNFKRSQRVQMTKSLVKDFRDTILLRRTPGPWTLYQQETMLKLMPRNQHRLFLKRKHRCAANTYGQRQTLHLLSNPREYLGTSAFFDMDGKYYTGETPTSIVPQSVLHLRTASQRTVFKYHPTQLSIAPELFNFGAVRKSPAVTPLSVKRSEYSAGTTQPYFRSAAHS